jgi:RimJ/RimL family protein N-acetyltransferase
VAADAGPEGFGHRLRPVEQRDAAAILELRTDPELGRYLNPTAGGVEDQERWIAAQRERAGDHYFVVETSRGRREGVIGLYDVEDGCAEWGRWILRRGSLAAPASVLLLLGFGFETVGLRQIRCRTLSANVPVIRFHDSCRYSTRTDQTDADGRTFVEHALVLDDWSTFCEALVPVAERVARREARP